MARALRASTPVVMAMNVHTSSKDGSDTSLNRLGELPDIFRVNHLDIYSVTNTRLSSFVNLTLTLPFTLYGSLPALSMAGYAGKDEIGRFQSYPVVVPPPPPSASHQATEHPKGTVSPLMPCTG
jgi:hypothetical protein